MGIGLHTIERFQRHAIRVTRSNQKIAKVSRVMRVGQVGARRRANVPDKWTQPGKHTGYGVWLKEQDGMLARVWREGGKLAGALRKIVGVGGIDRQAKLAVVVENDGITLLKAEGVDDCAALDAANAALSGSLNAAGRPRRAASWTLLINKRIVAKGG